MMVPAEPAPTAMKLENIIVVTYYTFPNAVSYIGSVYHVRQENYIIDWEFRESRFFYDIR
jgi:hypothetical protein